MKNRFLILIVLLVTTFPIFAQGSQRKHFSPEIKIFYNQTVNAFADFYGFGVGVHNAFFNQNRFNLIIGLEYNALFCKDYLLEGYYKYQLQFVSIPVNARVNFGKKVKFFIEAGAFFDPVVYGKIIFLDESLISLIDDTGYLFKPDFGISCGVGLRIPVNKFEIIIKSDYKLGIRGLVEFCPIAICNNYWRFAVGFKI